MPNNDEIQEILLDKNTGYLRVPQAIKDKFGAPVHYPNPTWRIEKNNKDVLELVYVFDKEKMRRD